LELHLSKAEKYLEKKANTYFCIHWCMQHDPEEKYRAYCRAYDEADALRIAESVLNFQRVMITGVISAQKHQISPKSIVFNCADVIRELEQTAI